MSLSAQIFTLVLKSVAHEIKRGNELELALNARLFSNIFSFLIIKLFMAKVYNPVGILKYIPSLSSLLLKNYNFGCMFKRVTKVSLS